MIKPLVLCILDGIGLSKEHKHNAVALANMPFFNNLLKKYPYSKLKASGTAVGLPRGLMGNSEVGHITIGSGRIVDQFLRRFEKEDLNKNLPLKNFIRRVQNSGGIVHLAALMSDGRVHSDIGEIITIAKYILANDLHICIHFIADGRDTPPKSALQYIKLIKKKLARYFASNRVFWGTLSGRYYSMDRNKNMDRTKLAFNAIAKAKAKYTAPTIESAVHAAYRRGETDELIYPTVIKGDVPITHRDGFVFGNYRSDRARQIVRAILTTKAELLCFSEYGEGLNKHCPALLPDINVKNALGDVLAKYGKSQLRLAETEKYNHVTYFFDAERNIDFKKEKKVLIPSPDVATFDMKPEMSAAGITRALLSMLADFDVIIMNFANGDMVGHTGNEKATITALEVLDRQLSKIVPRVLKLGGVMLITADHGNAEKMWDKKTKSPWKAHTTNPVPFVVISDKKYRVHSGGLSDIAPTILRLLNIPQPREMTGKSLIK